MAVGVPVTMAEEGLLGNEKDTPSPVIRGRLIELLWVKEPVNTLNKMEMVKKE